MFKSLSPGDIGIRGLSLSQAIELAQKTGFGGINFSVREAAQLVDERGIDYVRNLFANAGILPGQWGLPVRWDGDEAEWKQGLEELPRLAAVGQELGCTRTSTWCPPGSNDRDFEANWAWHIARFRPIAEILAEYGCRLGIEFIGPQTIRDKLKYDFV